ncbi:MAG: cyclic nucleotide-binding domain-containing protein [Spirochaetaceae bacterium]|nr:MAG: cyclic nucleotide-binding domain-containing protein [Spirochaetaceae bacterium]
MNCLPIDNNAIFQELRKVDMFQYFTDQELSSFIEMCEQREYETGERILHQGNLEKELYILIEGAVTIRKRTSDGSDIAVSTLEKGDVFGEASIFLDVPRTAGAVAIQPARLLFTTRERLFSYCNDKPYGGLKIFSHIIFSLLNKLASASNDLVYNRESMVTDQDMERLKEMFPSLDQVIGSEESLI